jgi:tRNA threonylcarbamoyladenosine biosynthesis protein TsaB
MESEQKAAAEAAMLLLGIDTCGSTGSVAFGRIVGHGAESLACCNVEILGEIELEFRTYSATLVSAVADLLQAAAVGLKDLGAIVAVHGPGSFTGVRIGLSAAKGLAEVSRIPVVVVSRLEVLAAKAGAKDAALDAHRSEVFLRICRLPGSPDEPGQLAACSPATEPIEVLAGAGELKAIVPPPARIAVCDEEAAALLTSAWPSIELLHVAHPTAADALRLAAARVANGIFVDLASPDLALLDGNYLRRSDAEIFGEAVETPRR